MFVRRKTYDTLMIRAKASGRALAEMGGELIDGMKKLGFDPAPRSNRETTAGRVIALLRSLLADVSALKIELETAQRERDEYRVDALKHRAARSNLKQFQPKPNGAGEVRA